MKRRKIIKFGLVGSLAASAVGTVAWRNWFDGPIVNSCLIEQLPENLVNHDILKRSFEGLDLSQLWDTHFHLIGNGIGKGIDNKPTGVWLNPKMTSWLSPIQKVQYNFYLNAACINDEETADSEFVKNINQIMSHLPHGIRFMLMAFDFNHDKSGKADKTNSTFFVPNEYAARVAKSYPAFEWVASVHPYRQDAVEVLEWCKLNGARAVKWLPPAMDIDPSSPRCDAYYKKLIDLDLPLITHAGDEKAVHSEELQKLANPLLLRRPLDQGVKVIVAHCASLGVNRDLDNRNAGTKSNFQLFARLMNDINYKENCLGDISAINLFNRELNEIKQIVENLDWHRRLLYASDYPLPGVVPIISVKNLADNG